MGLPLDHGRGPISSLHAHRASDPRRAGRRARDVLLEDEDEAEEEEEEANEGDVNGWASSNWSKSARTFTRVGTIPLWKSLAEPCVSVVVDVGDEEAEEEDADEDNELELEGGAAVAVALAIAGSVTVPPQLSEGSCACAPHPKSVCGRRRRRRWPRGAARMSSS